MNTLVTAFARELAMVGAGIAAGTFGVGAFIYWYVRKGIK